MRYIKLTQGKRAIVDDEDFGKLGVYNWRYFDHGSGYAVRRPSGKHGINKVVYMHREIIGAVKGQQVDHKNGDGLDNRKENLRFSSQKQNCQNKKSSKKYKGVYRVTDRVGFRSSIYINGKSKYLGYFYNQEDAAKAYDKAAKYYFGEFAKTNYD